VVLLNEHITSQEKVGMGIAFAGTFITILEPIFTNKMAFSQLTGNFLVILYLLVNTLSAIMAKRLVRKGVTPLTLSHLSFIVGFLTITPLALVFGGQRQIIETIKELAPPFHFGVFYMALLSGNLAYTLWIKGQKTIEVGEAALFSYLYPVFSAPLAVFWLKEKITSSFVIGAILIITGVVIAESKKRR
jgi:drug/metabolite transporter (DMT)-like permease